MTTISTIVPANVQYNFALALGLPATATPGFEWKSYRPDSASFGPGIGVVGAAVLGGRTASTIGKALVAAKAAAPDVKAGTQLSVGMKALGRSAALNVGIGAAITTGLSVVSNTLLFATGHITKGQAVGSVATDTVGGILSSTGAVVVGGAATALLGAAGVVGLPLTIAGVGLGIAASLGTELAFRKSGLANSMYTGIANSLGG